MQQIKGTTDLSEDLVRHMVLTSLLGYKQKFSGDYGKLIICADDKENWRKSVFTYYKANRKKNRDKSALDWVIIFDLLEKVKKELKEFFPFKFIQVPFAEADDIIGVLCKNKSMLEKTLIVSSDKDMKQLLRYNNVEFYSVYHKEIMDVENPTLYLKEHIMSGDTSDGIPNFLSDDDTFIQPDKRQSPLTAKRLDVYLKSDPSTLEDRLRKNFERNRILIDMECIPEDVQAAIMNEYETGSVADGKKLFKFFIDSGLKNLMCDLPEFLR